MTRESPTCEMRVLLISGGPDDPTSRAWARELERSGVPFDQVAPTAEEPLEAAALLCADGNVGRYNAIVLGTDSSTFWGALAALPEYRARFGVRQISGFEFPRESAGLASAEGRPLDGLDAALTMAGRVIFPYLRGPVPIPPGAYGYLARPSSNDLAPLLTHESGTLVGLYRRDGLEDVVITVNYADGMLHWLLLARGLIGWVTKNTHFGLTRNHLACHIDDIFLANWLSAPGRPGEPGTVRMTRADVEAVLGWQDRNAFMLDFAYNGFGADPEDDLTRALLADRECFRWINHTWSHVPLGKVTATSAARRDRWPSVEEIHAEISRNVQWAREVGVDASPTALITGAHSGLDHPHLSVALERAGITAIASDASVDHSQRQLGPALTVPRYPTNVYTGASTWAEQLEQYAERYGADAPGATSPAAFLAAEAAIVLQHMLSNDPRPTFAHQSNLTRDRVMLDLLEYTLTRYRSYLNETCPPVSPTLDEAAAELSRQSRWQQVLGKGEVRGRVGVDELVVTADVDVDVPVTVPAGTTEDRRHRLRRRAFGQSYAGTRSAWHFLAAGEELRLLRGTG